MTAVTADTRFAPRTGGTRPLAGTGALLRLALRRDRVMLPLWVLVVGGTTASAANSLGAFYDTPEERANVISSMATNSSLRSLYGPVFDDSLGALVSWRYVAFMGAFAAVMSLLLVVRHTREEEETGRQEMLASLQVGRRASLTAALLTALIANAGIALLVTLGLAGEGAAGALALGLAIAGVGMVFATLAAVCAQLTETARLARGLTAAVLGLAWALKAAGDAARTDGSHPLTWLSPIGWAENMRAFAGERWWVVLLFAAVVAVQAVVAYTLAGRRDVGMSFIPARPGPAEGRLSTATSLAWRLQRGALLGWGAGFLLAGIMFGSMTEGAADLVGDNENTKEMLERMGGQAGVTDAFLAAMLGMLAMVGALYIVQSVLRLNGEETAQRAEPVLAAAVGRVRWAAGHLYVAFGGAALLLLLGGLGLAVGYRKEAGPLLGASLVQIAAVWLLGSFAVLVYGLLPRLAPLGWAYAALSLGLGWIGPALNLPDAALNLSPFQHLPKMPGNAMEWTPVLVQLALAAVFTVAGLVGLRRRDMQS
ncbi:ABC transporter permease [Streptomyces indicus]|uniref:ABC-2 type transport system permease protein n=1 Tax=Streptomyces indicus TaxID=417292 RepID=A0A1G9CEZ7_9ACTN|nr:ABC transporter permease [Streptomyces indicus]SDK50241.1 ABC-2 type transport system permease protein [Streptomyces indicus]